MTKAEYIRQLEFSLDGKLSKREISEILRDYSEYFDAAKTEGKTEEEIAQSLGIPSVVAEQILSENEEEAQRRRKTKKTHFFEKEKEVNEKISLWLEKIKTFFVRLGHAIAEIFKKNVPSPQKKEQTTENSAQKTHFSYEDASFQAPVQPSKPSFLKRHPFLRTIVYLLLGILALPLIIFALFIAACILGGIIFIIGCAAFFLLTIAALLLFLFTAGIFTAASIGGGIGIPMTAILLIWCLSILCLAGGVLFICLTIYLIRWLIRCIKMPFIRKKHVESARNPAYQARQNAAEHFHVYEPADDEKEEKERGTNHA